mmetsp:Transcript_15907/g.28754  ORF Transcript_15907/g.28754 Transcript_15907/m.28754 type:complete len:124 (-) Transcript_15907:740-1111(-)
MLPSSYYLSKLSIPHMQFIFKEETPPSSSTQFVCTLDIYGPSSSTSGYMIDMHTYVRTEQIHACEAHPSKQCNLQTDVRFALLCSSSSTSALRNLVEARNALAPTIVAPGRDSHSPHHLVSWQ